MFGWIKNLGLSWKVQLAPAFLILFLIAVGAYALLALRSNQAETAGWKSEPVVMGRRIMSGLSGFLASGPDYLGGDRCITGMPAVAWKQPCAWLVP